jgi:predicted nicotinamide N-methyase
MHSGAAMAGYQTRDFVIAIGDHDFRVQALSDTQQFSDPEGLAERADISSSNWSLFGQVWPAGRVLAQAMDGFDVAGKRILEVGCGLALSSLVLKRRDADITASDHHPLAGQFLLRNTAANDLPPITFETLDWKRPDPGLGRFDLIVGSDVLYERGHAGALAALLRIHARRSAEIVIADPGRGHRGSFTQAMVDQGYQAHRTSMAFAEGETPPHKGCLMHYRR